METLISPFDQVAVEYDTSWTASVIGQMQRRAVWSFVDPLIPPRSRVLDLGCGTGADAVHFRDRGIHVFGIDSSSEMVRVAQGKGINATVLNIEDLHQIQHQFDAAISNFGALNCVESLPDVAYQLARLVRRGGLVALCMLGRMCAWEIGFYLLNGEIRKATRRLSGRAAWSNRIPVFYPSKRSIRAAFNAHFRLIGQAGIGLAVPPSYVTHLSNSTLQSLAELDKRLASRLPFRSFADHQLYLWRRL